MSRLQTIQADFQACVLADGQGGGERMAIYRNAYRSRLRDALCEAYDKTWSYAGDELFIELADSYRAAHPSTFRNLRRFGDGFAAHVAHHLAEHPAVAELAAFEWALGIAFDAPDARPVSQEDLKDVPFEAWPALVFAFHPSLQIVEMGHNSVALWQALDAGVEPPDMTASPAPVCWAVWRRDNQPHFRSLDDFEARVLREVGSGQSFGDVCARAASDDDAMLRMAACLQNWLAQAMLVPRDR